MEGASNWLDATSTVSWDQPGVYSGSPSTAITVTTQSFDLGNENIEMDITDEVNSLITGGTTNYGYGLSFERDLETLIRIDAQYVGFFKKDTQTYYEPFVETIYNNPIRDDRNRFYKGKTNKLYLYVNVGGELTNLDNNPSVTIKDENDAGVTIGAGATGFLAVNGKFDEVRVLDPGFDYLDVPRVKISGGNPTRPAVAEAK